MKTHEIKADVNLTARGTREARGWYCCSWLVLSYLPTKASHILQQFEFIYVYSTKMSFVYYSCDKREEGTW